MRKRQLDADEHGLVTDRQAAAYFSVCITTIWRWRRIRFKGFPNWAEALNGDLKEGFFRSKYLKVWETGINRTDFMDEICDRAVNLHREKGALYIYIADAAELLGVKKYELVYWAQTSKITFSHFLGRINQKFKFNTRAYIRLRELAVLLPALADKEKREEIEVWIKDLTEE